MASSSTTTIDRNRIGALLVELVSLAVPLALVQTGAAMLGFIDTAVVGRTTPAQLAGVGLGNSLQFAVAVIGMGAVLGSEPIIAQAVGAGDFARARRAYRQGMWTALLSFPLVAVAVVAIAWLALPRTDVDPDVVPFVHEYLIWRLPAMLPFFLYWSTKAWLQAHGQTRAPLFGVLLANVVELVLDVLLVFGRPELHIPALGVAGAGIAHTVSTTVRLVVVLVAAHMTMADATIAGEERARTLGERWQRMIGALDVDGLWSVARVGVPLGLQLALEVTVFAFASFLMGTLGKAELAAHQVALQSASVTFNAMVGLGSASAIVVGKRIGAHDREGALRAGVVALLLSTAFMCATGGLFFFGGAQVAALLTDDATVIAEAAALLAVAAAFQLSDGLQAVASGALRGAGDTRVSFLAHLVAHWLVGMPCVLWFLHLGMRGPGIWWGLTCGLTVAAVVLVLRFITSARAYRPL